MNKLICNSCGSDELKEKESGIYVCANCNAKYVLGLNAKDSEYIISHTEKALWEQTVAQIEKMLFNLRTEVQREYLNDAEIVHWCRELKKLIPDHFLANFYEKAIGSDKRALAEYIGSINTEDHYEDIPEILKFAIKLLSHETLLSINELIRRAYEKNDPERFNEWNEILQPEAQKVSDGVYDETLPRDVFVAYKSDDIKYVNKLVDYLENEEGLTCYVAARNLRHGKISLYDEMLKKAMDSCRAIVFVSTKKSRVVGDARTKELPYVKKTDYDNSPNEYRARNDYANIPWKYKKQRVEYLVEGYADTAGEMWVKEFFYGCEHARTPKDVATSLIEQRDRIDFSELSRSAQDSSSKNDVKFCIACGEKNPEKAKRCMECGEMEFVSTEEEYKLIKIQHEQQKQAAITQAIAEEKSRTEQAVREKEEQEQRKKQADAEAKKAREEAELARVNMFISQAMATSAKHEMAKNVETMRKADETEKITETAKNDSNNSSWWERLKNEPKSKLCDDEKNEHKEREKGQSDVQKRCAKEFEHQEKQLCSNIKTALIGIGGAGIHAVDHMISIGIDVDEFITIDTDRHALRMSKAQKRIQIGSNITNGFGTSGNAEQGRIAAEGSKVTISNYINNFDVIFFVAGIGGGTGTGATPVIAELARNLGKLTIAFVTTPFTFEGEVRMRNAQIGIANLRKFVHSIIIIPNERLASVAKDMPMQRAFEYANDILYQGVQVVSEIINNSNRCNIDFVDLAKVLRNGGDAIIGRGRAKGDKRAIVALQKAVNNAVLCRSIDNASQVIVNIEGGDVKMDEISKIGDMVRSVCIDGASVKIGWSVVHELHDLIQVSVIATGMNDDKSLLEGLKQREIEMDLAEAQAWTEKGVEYYIKKQYEEAAKWLRKAAEQGDADAQYNLGVCYDNGRGVPQDYAEAVKWYRKAAEQGDADAQYNLGVCYIFGRGVKRDCEEAEKWFIKAVEHCSNSNKKDAKKFLRLIKKEQKRR